jgi:hypothetical protein
VQCAKKSGRVSSLHNNDGNNRLCSAISSPPLLPRKECHFLGSLIIHKYTENSYLQLNLRFTPVCNALKVPKKKSKMSVCATMITISGAPCNFLCYQHKFIT